MSEQVVESCELGLWVCNAAHAAGTEYCEVSAVYFFIILTKSCSSAVSYKLSNDGDCATQ